MHNDNRKNVAKKFLPETRRYSIVRKRNNGARVQVEYVQNNSESTHWQLESSTEATWLAKFTRADID